MFGHHKKIILLSVGVSLRTFLPVDSVGHGERPKKFLMAGKTVRSKKKMRAKRCRTGRLREYAMQACYA
jgi:hypothetical protein